MTTSNAPVLHPDLTPAQRDCLDDLPLTGHHVVSGPPGSGKSLLAAHRVVHLALTGRPTLLLSRSNLLRQLLHGTLQGLTVPGAPAVAATVHSWVLRRFGRSAPPTEDGWFDWTALIHRAAATFGDDDPATPTSSSTRARTCRRTSTSWPALPLHPSRCSPTSASA